MATIKDELDQEYEAITAGLQKGGSFNA